MKFHFVDRKAINLSEAQEIGILFDASDPDKISAITNFTDSLKKDKKKISLLGFYDTPKKAINFNFSYFNKKDLNWFLEPNGNVVEEFISRRFDILINAYLDENLPLEYVSSLSQASFRIGSFNRDKTYAYDFMIDMKGERDLQILMTQFKHYLEMI